MAPKNLVGTGTNKLARQQTPVTNGPAARALSRDTLPILNQPCNMYPEIPLYPSLVYLFCNYVVMDLLWTMWFELCLSPSKPTQQGNLTIHIYSHASG